VRSSSAHDVGSTFTNAREAQRREILEMSWLIDDIERNGIARTRGDAESRPVPDFEEPAERGCPPG
jgi:hypothetical protein